MSVSGPPPPPMRIVPKGLQNKNFRSILNITSRFIK
jgi:hypothetical protein